MTFDTTPIRRLWPLGNPQRLDGACERPPKDSVLELIEQRPAVQAGVSVIDRSAFDLLTGQAGDIEQLAKDAFGLVQTGSK